MQACAAVYQVEGGDRDVSVSIQSPAGDGSELQDSWRWRTFPIPKLFPSKLSPAPPPPPRTHLRPPPCTRATKWMSPGGSVCVYFQCFGRLLAPIRCAPHAALARLCSPVPSMARSSPLVGCLHRVWDFAGNSRALHWCLNAWHPLWVCTQSPGGTMGREKFICARWRRGQGGGAS